MYDSTDQEPPQVLEVGLTIVDTPKYISFNIWDPETKEHSKFKLYKLGIGTTVWYVHTKGFYFSHIFHRLDGPALVRPNLKDEFWINGRQYNELDYWIEVDRLKRTNENPLLPMLIS